MNELLSSLRRNVASGFRLALFRPVSREHFHTGAEHYAMLAGFNLLVWIAGSWLRSAEGAAFVPGAVPPLLAYIPIILLACLFASRLLHQPALLLPLAVMLSSTDLLFEIVGTLIFLAISVGWAGLGAKAQLGLYGLYVLWAMASVLRAEFLLVSWRSPGAKATALLLAGMVLLLVYVPREEPWAAPPEEPEAAQAGPLQEDVFHLQGELLDRELDRLSAQRPGVADLYFLGAAPYARQDTFVRELAVVRKLIEDGYDANGHAVALMNHASTVGAMPIATTSNLRVALARLGETLNAEEDVLMLFITSHGSAKHELSFDFPPLQLRQLNPTSLSRMLADSGIKWKIIVISACYSGGFIEALKDDNTLVITAADATHTSFGCEAESDFTWFSRAYFDQALRGEAEKGSFSFTDAFEQARTAVAEREKSSGYEPSNPQMFVGAAMRDKLKELQGRLGAAAKAQGEARKGL